MESRICLYAAGWSFLLVFVVIPSLIMKLGFAPVIFYQGEITAEILLLNLLAILPFFIGAIVCNPTFASCILHSKPSNKYPVTGIYLFIFAWVIAFCLTGGLYYRDSDVLEGYASRGMALQIVLMVQNTIIICCSYLLFTFNVLRWRKRATVVVIIALFACSIAFSGSRGILVQLALTIWGTKLISTASSAEIYARRKGLLSLSGLITNVVTALRYILLGILAAGALGVWGLFRDGQDDILFSTLLRAAEPYWHHAYVYHEGRGVNWNILSDALSRIMSIPQRWFGISFEGSIDGHEYILGYYLEIDSEEGVSLPITLLGHGFLFAGHIGAFAFCVFAALMVVISIRMLRALPFPNQPLYCAFIAYQFTKCFFFYPKSLSGIFLVLFYETARDYVALYLLFTGYRIARNVAIQNS